MVNSYVVAPNFAIEPPPLIPRALAGQHAPGPTAPTAQSSGASTTTPTISSTHTRSPFSETVQIQLGDILVDPFGAEWRPVNRYSRTAIDGKYVEKPSKLGGFKETRANLLEGRLGVMASMLAALNLGLDFNVSLYWQSKSHEIIEVKTLETHTFDVTDDYIKMLLASTPVKDHLKKHPKDNLYLVSGLKVAKGAKQNVDQNASAGADMSAGDAANNIANIKALKLAWKRSKRREFKTATDFVMAVRLRRIKLDDKGELADHYLSLKKTTMEDGTPVVKESDQGPLLVYAGLDDDLSPEKKIFMKDLYEVGGKPKEEREIQNIQNFDEADDYVFLPDLSDEEDE